jgi:hypothetical protein
MYIHNFDRGENGPKNAEFGENALQFNHSKIRVAKWYFFQAKSQFG